MQYFILFLHWEGRNICAHNTALFTFNIFLNWRCGRDGTKMEPISDSRNSTRQSIIFISIIYFLRCLKMSENNEMAYEGKIWVRDLPVIYFEAHKNCMHATCVREIPYSKMMNTFMLDGGGNSSIWYENTRQRVWGAHSYPSKFTDVWVRETATEYAGSMGSMGTSIRTCLIIICHWN